MPNFGGLASTFGEAEPEPEPEPVETEEDRIARELFEVENKIIAMQARARGFLTRQQFAHLQKRIKWSQQAVTSMQATCRGALTRTRLHDIREERSGSAMKWVVPLQSIARGKLVQDQQKQIQRHLMVCKSTITSLQAQGRGIIAKENYDNKKRLISRQERLGAYHKLQAHCRGMLTRDAFKKRTSTLNNRSELQRAIRIQSSCRGFLARSEHNEFMDIIKKNEPTFLAIQTLCRSKAIRSKFQAKSKDIKNASQGFIALQAQSRGLLYRRDHDKLSKSLTNASSSKSVALLQAFARGFITRQSLNAFRQKLASLSKEHVIIQACARGSIVRDECESILAYLDDNYKSIVAIQALSQTALIQERYSYLQSMLDESATSICQMQSRSRGFLVRDHVENIKTELMDEPNMRSIIDLQSLSRATLVRRNVWDVFQQLESAEDDVVKCQSQARGYLIRKDQKMWKRHLQVSQPEAVNLQSIMRGYNQRKKFGEKKTHYRTNKEKIVKIQALYRGREKREQFKELTMGNNVPLNTVKEFVHLLDDSDYDFDEEIELVDLRKRVLEAIRETQALESHVDELDVKIALVVKNALSFDELVRAAKGRLVASGTLNRNGSVLAAAGDPFSPGKMDKQTVRRLELYQQLFWRLQNQPEYLGRLFYNMSRTEVSDKNRRLIENVIMTLFGYTQSAREEYLFLKVMQVRSSFSRILQTNPNPRDPCMRKSRQQINFQMLLEVPSHGLKCSCFTFVDQKRKVS